MKINELYSIKYQVKKNKVTYKSRREIINIRAEINEIVNQRGHKTKSLLFEKTKK